MEGGERKGRRTHKKGERPPVLGGEAWWGRSDAIPPVVEGGFLPDVCEHGGQGPCVCSPVLGRGEARRAAAAIAGERLPGGTHVVMAEGQEAAGGARVQHARAVEDGEAALGQGSLEGTKQALSVGCTYLGFAPSPLPHSLPCVCVFVHRPR